MTELEVRQFIEEWFLKLDTHAPVDEVLPLVADKELMMRLPETIVRGHSGFIAWYERVTRTFFDEIHTIHARRITPSEDSAKVEMVLQWQTSIWDPPQANSKRKGFFAAQTWELKRSPVTQKPFIVTYNVDYFIPMEGSDAL